MINRKTDQVSLTPTNEQITAEQTPLVSNLEKKILIFHYYSPYGTEKKSFLKILLRVLLINQNTTMSETLALICMAPLLKT